MLRREEHTSTMADAGLGLEVLHIRISEPYLGRDLKKRSLAFILLNPLRLSSQGLRSRKESGDSLLLCANYR